MSDSKAENLSKQVYKIYYGTTPGDEIIDLFGNSNNANVPAGAGKPQLHALYPDEFELYACAFELINSDGSVADFFSFPVMPFSIEQTKSTNASIKKTYAGVIVNSNPTFKPFDIVISGDFGRKFKYVSNKVDSSSLSNGDFNSSLPKDTIQLSEVTVKAHSVFSSDYKTGYGCTKRLESIIELAKMQDSSSQPYRLIFYNLAYNSNYLIEPTQIRIYQNRSKNMVWSYSINMRAVAPASAVQSKDDIKNALTNTLKLSNLNVGIQNQSSIINKLLNPNGQIVTKVENIINAQLNARLIQGITGGNNNKKSAIQAIKELTGNPNDIDSFTVNTGENVLNSRF